MLVIRRQAPPAAAIEMALDDAGRLAVQDRPLTRLGWPGSGMP
jgi:hypothetical protein